MHFAKLGQTPSDFLTSLSWKGIEINKHTFFPLPIIKFDGLFFLSTDYPRLKCLNEKARIFEGLKLRTCS